MTPRPDPYIIYSATLSGWQGEKPAVGDELILRITSSRADCRSGGTRRAEGSAKPVRVEIGGHGFRFGRKPPSCERLGEDVDSLEYAIIPEIAGRIHIEVGLYDGNSMVDRFHFALDTKGPGPALVPQKASPSRGRAGSGKPSLRLVPRR